MAIPKYQSNYLGDFWTSYTQRRRTGGRPLTSYEMRGLLSPIMQAESSKAIAAGEREEARRRWDQTYALQKTAMDRQQSAATVGGIADIASLGLSYKLGADRNSLMRGFLGGGGGGAGPAAYQQATQGAANFLGGAPPALGGAYNFAYQAPQLAGDFSFGVPSAIAEAEAAAGAATAATPGLGVGMGAGIIGGVLGNIGLQKLGVNKDISESLAYGAAGFAVGGPVGAAIGLGVSLIDDIFGGLF